MDYITVHNTGNAKKGADADNHTNYVDGINDYISWHFTVDDNDIIQEMPVNEVAWHAGTTKGNYNSIGIEICENVDGNWKQARENGIQLIAQLMVDMNIPITRVVTHQSWSGKYCPHLILDEGWDKFIAEVKKAYDGLTGASKTNDIIKATQSKPEAWIKAVDKIKQIANDPNADPDLKVFKFIDGFIQNLNAKK